jgi:UDP-2,3-diacylglucosamine pyrophosphatase LpxH
MNQKLFFISDIEMGRGDVTDDFNDDELLTGFLETIASNPKTVLVLNGDIFDFLKMNYKDSYPHYITEEISLWKLGEAFKAHPKVLKTLQAFTKDKTNHIHFIIGNHDADLAWPAVQQKLIDTLDSKNPITFGFKYETPDIHAEHGHLQDPLFANNINNPIINLKGKKILNMAWGAYVCARHLVGLKRKFPKEEQFFPNPLAFKKYPKYKWSSRFMSLNLILQSLIISPIIYFRDPTYRPPYIKLIKHFLKYGLEFMDDERFLNNRAQQVIEANSNKKIIVLGHAHVLSRLNRKSQKIFFTDTWRTEFDLRKGSAKKPKTYVEIGYDGKELVNAELKEWK